MEREPFLRRYRRFFGADPRRDVDEELAFHLAMREEEFRRAGLSDAQAEEATMKRFGNMREVHDEVETLAVKRHERRRRAWQLDALRQDLRFAWRTLVANPGYSIIIALTLAIGLGANAAVFSVAYGVLLRPLPYRDADRLVRIFSSNVKLNLERFSVSPGDFVDWRTNSRAFSDMAAFERQRDATLTVRGEPTAVSVARVSAELFPLLGTAPQLGRTLSESDMQPTAPPSVVISNALWQTTFGADSAIIGRGIVVDGAHVAIVGVMPPRFIVPGSEANIWGPLSMDGLPMERGNRFLRVLGRLAPGATMESAHAQLETIAERAERESPENSTNWRTFMLPVPELLIGTQFRGAVITLIGVAAFVLLIACANAANLQLARAAARERELAVRAALGASRGRIGLQLLTESVLIAAIAGVIGIALAYAGVELLRTLGTTTVPRLEDVKLDAPVLLFMTAIALGSGLLFGLAPALRASHARIGDVLKSGGGRSGTGVAGHVRGALVVAEIALSLVLLIGAGLLMRSFLRLQQVELGFNEKNLLIARTALPQASYPTVESVETYYRDALDRIAAIGGVESVVAVSNGPFAGGNPGLGFVRVGMEPPDDAPAPGAALRYVTPGYFRTMGVRLIRGRDFTSSDGRGAPGTAVVSTTFAKKYFANEDPIGQRIRINDRHKGQELTIVGIVDDVRYQSLESETLDPMLYQFVGAAPSPQRAMMIVARARTANAEQSVKATFAALDGRLPPPPVRRMEELVGMAMAPQRFAFTLITVFAITAVVLAAIGLYGVLAYLVRQRTRELGLRVALGAPRSSLLALVVVDALRLTAIGVAVGLVAAYGLAGTLENLLFGVTATDTMTFLVLPAFLALVTLVASLVPALRATRADPMQALRGEA
jgi:predicted permease